MKFNKEGLIVGFALFALFFGAGNLILPPFLGFLAGSQWYLVALGFVISAVGLPLMGIFAHARHKEVCSVLLKRSLPFLV
jgi:LIVCS family branched-chain amino acid:cation transporter